MQAVILAAGRGVRMGELTENRPKPMLLIGGKPKLEYSLRMLPDVVTEVILVVGYRSDMIREHFGTEFDGRSIRYAEQSELNGSGGAIHLTKDMVEGKFLVLMGDDLYLKEDMDRMLGYDLAVLACEMEDSSQFGALEIDALGRLAGIIERPHPPEYTLVNTGAYVLNRHFFEYPLVPISDAEFGLPQTLVQMRVKHAIVIEKTQTWLPIGDPEALQEAQTRINDFLI
ncbi:MAG: sugar phosphate nucleotidyltransferase [Patescibacteria group bacterium]